MKLLLKTQILAVIISILFLLLSNHSIAERIVQPEAQDNYSALEDKPLPTASQIVPVYFGLKENNQLSPELPPEGKKDLIAPCPKKFVPARWSVLGFIGTYEWVDVGTWSTEPVNKALQARGIVQFRIWVSYTGTGTPTGNFDFYWRRNEENIAEVTNFPIQFQSNMQPKLVEATSNLFNQTPFQADDVFSLYIRCRNEFDGAQIIFGSREHNSAVVMECNPIDLIEIKMCQGCIKGIYNDVFRVKPTTMTFIAKVDEIELRSVPKIDFETINNMNYQSVTWEAKLDPGIYMVEVGISYMGSDNTTIVSLIQEITIETTPEPTLLGLPLWLAYLIIGLVIIIILAAVAVKLYSIRQEREWLKQMDKE